MSTTGSCNVGASKSNDDDVCEVAGKLEKMKTAEDNEEEDVSVCANCGKEGANNICNKCKMVTYCNAACKKKHRHKHKKQCEEHIRLAAEHAAKLHDEELFKQPPPQEEDCPICFLRLPTLDTGRRYKSCCGKIICSGCSYAPVYDNQGNKVDDEKKCPFCRTPASTSEKESIERDKKRMEASDPIAVCNIGTFHSQGIRGFPQDHTKALEYWHRAGEVGYSKAYAKIGVVYEFGGRGVEIDKTKANHYYELSAMGGNAGARFLLGCMEKRDAGAMKRALKHWMISVRSGHSNSLNKIRKLYSSGDATKDDYTKALQLYQEYLKEIKSVQRDKAAADREDYRYY